MRVKRESNTRDSLDLRVIWLLIELICESYDSLSNSLMRHWLVSMFQTWVQGQRADQTPSAFFVDQHAWLHIASILYLFQSIPAPLALPFLISFTQFSYLPLSKWASNRLVILDPWWCLTGKTTTHKVSSRKITFTIRRPVISAGKITRTTDLPWKFSPLKRLCTNEDSPWLLYHQHFHF